MSADDSKSTLTFYQSRVQAGFPSPADDYIDGQLNLHELLISNAPATFFVRVQGDSMIEAGIFDGDLLIVDKSLSPHSGSIVIASLDGDFTVKKLVEKNKRYYLQACNKQFPTIDVTERGDFAIWGVVIHSIHSFRS